MRFEDAVGALKNAGVMPAFLIFDLGILLKQQFTELL
jgi:hypothetical protein